MFLRRSLGEWFVLGRQNEPKRINMDHHGTNSVPKASPKQPKCRQRHQTYLFVLKKVRQKAINENNKTNVLNKSVPGRLGALGGLSLFRIRSRTLLNNDRLWEPFGSLVRAGNCSK